MSVRRLGPRAASAVAALSLIAGSVALSGPAAAIVRQGPATCAPHWVGSWINSPSDALSAGDPSLHPFLAGPRQSYR